jgi:hypothetical protein
MHEFDEETLRLGLTYINVLNNKQDGTMDTDPLSQSKSPSQSEFRKGKGSCHNF